MEKSHFPSWLPAYSFSGWWSLLFTQWVNGGDMCVGGTASKWSPVPGKPVSLCKYWHDSAKTLWSFRRLDYLFFHSTWSKDVVALKLKPKMWIIAWQWTVNANERFKLITQGPTSRSVAVTSVSSTIWMMKKGTVCNQRDSFILVWHSCGTYHLHVYLFRILTRRMRTIQEDQASVFHRILRALRPFEVGKLHTADRCNVTGGMINMLQPFFFCSCA